jgi:hypothetical protein
MKRERTRIDHEAALNQVSAGGLTRRRGLPGIVLERIFSQQTPHHGTKKQEKKTDNPRQDKKYRPGIGPHFLDLGDDTHQRTSPERIVIKKKTYFGSA